MQQKQFLINLGKPMVLLNGLVTDKNNYKFDFWFLLVKLNFNFLNFGILISIRSNKPGKQYVKIHNPIINLNILGIINNKATRKNIIM